MMRLLPKSVAKSAIRKQEEALEKTNQELGEQIAKKSQEVSRLREDERVEFLALKASYDQTLQVLRIEVSDLQAEKDKLLNSDDILKKEAHFESLFQDLLMQKGRLEAFAEQLSKKENWLNLQEKQFSNEWKALDQRKIRITEREGALEVREARLSSMDAELQRRAKSVNEEIARQIGELNIQSFEIERQKSHLGLQNSLLDVREREAAETLAKIEEERTHLESQQAALKAAFEHARKRGIM